MPPTPPNSRLGVYGKVTDAATGAPLREICVTVGIPGALCWGRTDVNGNYTIDMVDPWAASPGQFEVYFLCNANQPACLAANPGGYATDHTPTQFIGSVMRIDFRMHK